MVDRETPAIELVKPGCFITNGSLAVMPTRIDTGNQSAASGTALVAVDQSVNLQWKFAAHLSTTLAWFLGEWVRFST